MDALARLAGNAHRIVGRDGKLILDLELDLIRMRGRQINLVDSGNDIKVSVHGKVRV